LKAPGSIPIDNPEGNTGLGTINAVNNMGTTIRPNKRSADSAGDKLAKRLRSQRDENRPERSAPTGQ